MYYRVATQVDASQTWQWKSPMLTLNTLFQFLKLYRMLPQDRLRVFSSGSPEDMDEMLRGENNGLGPTSVTAAQFLGERGFRSPEVGRGASEGRTTENQEMVSIAVVTNLPLNESGMNVLERRRVELECGVGGDHDLPYTFTLPTSMPQVLAWMKLLTRVQNGEVQP